MTKATQPLTIEQMTEWLYGRAEEIFLLCCIINRRGLAHAFCDLSGHVSTFDSRIFPVDANYILGRGERTEPTMQLHTISMSLDHLYYNATLKRFEKTMKLLDDYADQLEAVIESNTPITTPEQAA